MSVRDLYDVCMASFACGSYRISFSDRTRESCIRVECRWFAASSSADSTRRTVREANFREKSHLNQGICFKDVHKDFEILLNSQENWSPEITCFGEAMLSDAQMH